MGRRRFGIGIVALVALVLAPLAGLAAHTFVDVPTDNVFHDDIAWLAEAGVTKGCNPPDNTEFCPGDNVTREQMAAFMRRLAQNKVVNAATAETADHATTAATAEEAGNADMLDGKDSAAYTSVVFGGGFTDSILAPASGVVASASTTLAIDGYAVIQYSFWAELFTGPFSDVVAWLQLDSDTCDFESAALPGSHAEQTVAEDEVEPLLASVAASTITQMSAGPHSVLLCVDAEGALVSDATVTGVFSPTGSGTVEEVPVILSDTSSRSR